jgi:DNA-binding CsgD family transcriptional regulator
VGIERDRLAEDFLSFALKAPAATSQGELLKELRQRVSPWGVTHTAACVMVDQERRFKIGSLFGNPNVAWADTYFRERLYLHDPVIDFALTARKAEYWEEAFQPARIGKAARRVLSLAADVGARDGFLVPVPLYNGDMMVVSYQGERLERHPDVAGVLRGLAHYFGVEGQRLQLNRRMQSGQLFGLNARQMQVMTLVMMGKRNKDIAHELQLSIKTVEYHLANIHAQLGAANTKEAVAIVNAAPIATDRAA